MKCKECKNADICLDHREEKWLFGCTSGEPDRRVATNADRIRSMTDEELADILFSHCVEHIGTGRCRSAIRNFTDRYDCNKCVLEWLRSESEVGKDA